MSNAPTRIEEAMRFACEAHKTQTRKSDGSPYVVHPLMCAHMLTRKGFEDDVIIAALLHDVLEDTGVAKETIRAQFGNHVLEIVEGVTEDKTLPWEERKAKYVDMVRSSSKEAKAVSIADKIHNLQSLLFAYEEYGPALWEKFNKGKKEKVWFEELCLAMFKETWSHPLVDEYEKLVGRMRTLE